MSNHPRDQRGPPPGRVNSSQPPYPTSSAAGYPSDDRRDRFPPPPMGDRYDDMPPSAMKKRSDRASRVHPDTRPAFPDEDSYLGSSAPDLERKNRPHHQDFRDKRDGYESEEGEQLRRDRPRSSRTNGGSYDDSEASRRPPRNQRPPADDRPPRDRPSRSQRDAYDDRDYARDRRRNDRYADDDGYDAPRSRRRGPDVEYGSDPIPSHRRTDDRGTRSRRDDYRSEPDDDYRPRRRRSHDEQRRAYDDAPRPRDRDRDRDRDRRRYSDDDRDDYRDHRRRGDRDRDRDDRDRDHRHGGRGGRDSGIPDLKIGKYDVGEYLQKGQKHYATVAPVLTPILMGMAKKYLGK